MVSSNYSFFPEHHLVHNTSLFPRFPINFPPFRASLPLQLTKDKKALFLRLPTRNKSPSSRFLRAPLPLICPPLCALPTPRCADFHPPLSARIAPTSTPSTFPLAGGLRIPFTATPTPGRCRPLSSPGASPYPRPAAGDHRRARAHTFLSHASPTLPSLRLIAGFPGARLARPAGRPGSHVCVRPLPRLPARPAPPRPGTEGRCSSPATASEPPKPPSRPHDASAGPRHSPEILRALQAHPPPPPRLATKPPWVSQAPRSGPAAPRVLAAAAIFL